LQTAAPDVGRGLQFHLFCIQFLGRVLQLFVLFLFYKFDFPE
jgi:hypothetical protein